MARRPTTLLLFSASDGLTYAGHHITGTGLLGPIQRLQEAEMKVRKDVLYLG